MSECSAAESGETLRPSAGRAHLSVAAPVAAEADFLALVDRVRADARLAARHGLLGRYDVPDDPDDGVGLFEALAFQDTSELNDSGWLDRIEATARLEARLAAWKAEAIAEYEASMRGVSADLGHRYPEPGDRDAAPGERRWVAGDLRSTADEIALVLQLHKGAATARIHTSCELVHNFPATLHALREGELTERAAFAVVRELSVLDEPETLRAAEEAVLDWASKHPLQRIKECAQREAARRSPAARSKSYARAMEERSVRIFPTSDGTAELVHTQDAIDAAAVMNSLNRAAARRRRDGDPRTLDQLRADIALARLLPRSRRADPLAHGASRDGDETDRAADAPDEAAIGANATVVIHATGAEIRALVDGQEGTGGEADHYGPIPQSSLRKHLIRVLSRSLLPSGAAPADARARIDIQVTDEPPDGSPDIYSPTAAVERFVRLRDRTCQFPGCNRPAEFADIDHRTAFAEGGSTNSANLHCLCRHHHRLKHHGGWTITANADGTTTWTSPTGRSYCTPPPDPG